MERIRLQFQNLEGLINFQKLITPGCYRIDVKNLMLTCDCDEEEIKRALADFNAEVVMLPFSTL